MSQAHVVDFSYEIVGKQVVCRVRLSDGRTGIGRKHSEFLGLAELDESDKSIAYERAVKDALRKKIPE